MGGSSGRLRNSLGILPPGDIRNCLAALSNNEDLITQLFQYRFSRDADVGLTDREKQKLKQIDDALDRIEENLYGLCEECGVKIPKARLKVVPFAKYCVECKEVIEREEKYTREEPEAGIKKVPVAEAEE